MSGGDPIKPINPGVKLTYDDYVHLPDDGLRHELIDGEHYVTPTPIRKHQAIATNLVGLVWTSSSRISTWSSPTFCSSPTSGLPGLRRPPGSCSPWKQAMC